MQSDFELPKNWLQLGLKELTQLSPLQPINHPFLSRKNINLSIKRDDQFGYELGGNKVYKLYSYLRDWQISENKYPLATFGGAYSNHLLALAKAASQLNIECFGVVRGDKNRPLSPTLYDAVELGMNLVFVTRETYKKRNTQQLREEISQDIGHAYWVPEGGSGVLGAKGFKYYADTILSSTEAQVDAICHACGTGSSLAGLIAENSGIHIKGFSVLKGYDTFHSEIQDLADSLQGNRENWTLEKEYHCGGYAKCPSYLLDFMDDFNKQTGVLLEPVYTGKMMFGIFDLINKDYWPRDSHIVAVHSGGLQGRRGFEI